MAGPINWLSQVASVSKFGLLSIPQRLGSVGAAVFGIAGVVAVLVGVLSMGAGFQKTLNASGAPDAAIVLRSGANTEMVSGFVRESTRIKRGATTTNCHRRHKYRIPFRTGFAHAWLVNEDLGLRDFTADAPI